MGYKISNGRMDEIFAELKKEYRIFAPKRSPKYIRYGEVSSVSEIVYQEKSHFSPKEVIFPIVQTLLYFTDNECKESELKDDRDIILFLRPCDVNGIRRLDNMFLKNGGHADNFYQRIREKVKFFMMECTESFETCFCVSMGSNIAEDYNVAVGFGAGEVKLHVKDADFDKVFGAEEGCDFTPAFVTENKKTVAVPDITDCGMIKEIHTLPFWREFDEKCIGCGGCNTVCITCSCFDTTDITYNETSRDGERRRNWSSCMLESYSTMAGGHNVRAKAGDRMRFKTMHKVYDYKARFGEENMCVGCGRCDMRCPKEIHFSETIDTLAKEVEKLKAKEGNKNQECGQHSWCEMQVSKADNFKSAFLQSAGGLMQNASKNITLPSPHKIIKIIHETKAEYTFRVKCDKAVKHGQFFVLSIPKIGEAPISVSAHGEGYVEFTIRKVGKLTDGLFGMDEGDTLFMRGPYGNAFPVEDFKGKHLVVIAGGTGMAPVRSMLQHFYEHMEEIASVHFIVGFKDRDAVLFEEDLAKFKEKFHTTYCLDNMEAEGFRKGFVTEYVKQVPFGEMEDYNVVIVGPPAMINFTAKACMGMEVPEEKIWVSFERKMSCSVGKCGHCKINETYVCLEGPVFNYVKAKELLD